MNKLPLIVLSGGLDSSYMLAKALREGDVHTCYIKASQHPDKIPLELMARQKVIDYFTKKTGNRVRSDTIVDFSHGINVRRVTEFGTVDGMNLVPDSAWGQAFLWLFGLLYVTDWTKHSKVCIGNVMGDSIALHLHDMVEAWDRTQRFAKQHPIPLEFPLAYTTKDAILDNIPLEIIPSLWICETPQVNSENIANACGHCQACRTMLKTIWNWEHEHTTNFKDWVMGRINNTLELLEIKKE